MERFIKQTALFFKNLYNHIFLKNNISLLAAAISFYAILSIIPLLFVFVSFSGFLLNRSDEAVFDLLSLWMKFFPSSTAGASAIISSLINTRQVIGLLGLAGLLWTSSRIFGVLESSLNLLWKVFKGRPYWKSKLISLVLVPISVVFLFTSIFLTGFYTLAQQKPLPFLRIKLSDFPTILDIFTALLPVILSFLIFFWAYKFLPNRKIPSRPAIIGALSASILWEISKLLFDIYVREYAGISKIYGPLGALAILVLWIYYSAYVFLTGAGIGASFELTRIKKESLTSQS